MKEMPLTKGLVAVVDETDYEWLSRWKWCVSRASKGNAFYAHRRDGEGTISMHRQIMGLTNGNAQRVDHLNCDPLDNRRANLRFATVSQNNFNVGLRKDNTSGFKGVFFDPKTRLWKAQLGVNRKRLSLGYYATPLEAHLAVRYTAAHYHGEFARTA